MGITEVLFSKKQTSIHWFVQQVDPNVHKEFVAWKQSPHMDKSDAFIARVYNEDINLCLDFNNKELGTRVQDAIERGNIFIEAVSDKTKTVFPKQV